MRAYFATLAIFVSSVAFGATCLNISGTYDLHPDGGDRPSCANGIAVKRSWLKYQQNGCEKLTFSYVYKLTNGNFCESDPFITITDGQERSSGNSELPHYKHTLYKDWQFLIVKDKSGNVYSRVYRFDGGEDGNLIIDESWGRSVYMRNTVE